MAKKEKHCVDCLEDRGRDFPASHVAPFFLPRNERWIDGEPVYEWAECRGDSRPVCDEHLKLNHEFWLAFTGRDANGNRPKQI